MSLNKPNISLNKTNISLNKTNIGNGALLQTGSAQGEPAAHSSTLRLS